MRETTVSGIRRDEYELQTEVKALLEDEFNHLDIIPLPQEVNEDELYEEFCRTSECGDGVWRRTNP